MHFSTFDNKLPEIMLGYDPAEEPVELQDPMDIEDFISE